MLKMLLALHIAGGSAALASMFVPMLTRKGGTLHRRAGWVFVTGMAIVSVTALLLSGVRAMSDPHPGRARFALFLFYIAVLTAAGVSTGVRVLRVRRARRPVPSWWDIGISSVLIATALGMVIFALVSKVWLFGVFSLVGLATGAGQLAYWLRPPADRMAWWFQHMGGMLGSSIAATTAFFVVNAERFGAASNSIAVWLAPTIVGVPVIAAWQVYYRRRFATAPAATRGTSRSTPAAGPYMPSHTS